MSTDIVEEDFNAADTILIDALGSGRTHAQAAKLARVSSKTVQRRLQDLDFARAVAERRRRRVDDLTAQLVGAADDAISVLTTLLGSPIGSDRLRTASIGPAAARLRTPLPPHAARRRDPRTNCRTRGGDQPARRVAS